MLPTRLALQLDRNRALVVENKSKRRISVGYTVFDSAFSDGVSNILPASNRGINFLYLQN